MARAKPVQGCIIIKQKYEKGKKCFESAGCKLATKDHFLWVGEVAGPSTDLGQNRFRGMDELNDLDEDNSQGDGSISTVQSPARVRTETPLIPRRPARVRTETPLIPRRQTERESGLLGCGGLLVIVCLVAWLIVCLMKRVGFLDP